MTKYFTKKYWFEPHELIYHGNWYETWCSRCYLLCCYTSWIILFSFCAYATVAVWGAFSNG